MIQHSALNQQQGFQPQFHKDDE